MEHVCRPGAQERPSRRIKMRRRGAVCLESTREPYHLGAHVVRGRGLFIPRSGSSEQRIDEPPRENGHGLAGLNGLESGTELGLVEPGVQATVSS